jgi:hypothetical protein
VCEFFTLDRWLRLALPAVRVGRDAEQVHDAPFDLDDEEHVVRPHQHGVDGEEVGGNDALGLGAQELGPGRPSAPWGEAKAVGSKDVGDASLRDAGAERLQFADDPQIAPRGFSVARRKISSTVLSGRGGRPGRRCG